MHGTNQEPFLVQRDDAAGPARGIENRTDAGIGGADQRHSKLDGAPPRHFQMLIGSTARAVPGIVGKIDERRRTPLHRRPRQLREDVLIADEDPKRLTAQDKGRRIIARNKIPGSLNQAARRRTGVS